MKIKTEINIDFETLVNIAVELNREKRNPDLQMCMSNSQFKSEFCTIHVNIGRMTGKTKYIINNMTPHSAAFFINERMLRHIVNVMHTEGVNFNQCYTFGNLNDPNRFRGMQSAFDTIFIDEPFYMTKNQKFALYDRLASRDINQTFIFLGE